VQHGRVGDKIRKRKVLMFWSQNPDVLVTKKKYYWRLCDQKNYCCLGDKKKINGVKENVKDMEHHGL
jgi:hypothetical protein